MEKPIKTARAYVCGLGWYELYLNGQKVGQRVLDPAQTDFSKRVLYTTYDITSHLQSGANVVGVIVGNGWYGTPKLLTQIEIHFEDDTTMLVVTGRRGYESHWWRVADGAIIENTIFDGEVYDARLERPEWNKPEGFSKKYPNLDMWAGAMITEAPGGQLVAQALEPVQVVETLKAQKISQPQPGIYVLDVGQNLAGWGLLTAQGASGTTITMRYAESLYEDGTVNQENLRSARARDVYILKGEGVEVWEPRFTYHGFRYIQIEGFPGELTSLESVLIRVVRSAVEPTGQFECDHPLLNQLHRAIWWTEASNLHGVPTDCPQRNERMGWLNDMAARSEELIHNFDVSRLLPKWLNDIEDTQDSDGTITDTAPYRWGVRPADPVSVCYLLIPWLLYCHYGDRHVLQTHYPGMKQWVDYLTTQAEACIVNYSYYGDWAPPITESIEGSLGSSAVARNTPGPLVSTAYYAYGAKLLSKIAHALGQDHEAAAQQKLFEQIRGAFNAAFWDETHGGYGTNNQACNSLALYIGLVPEERKAQVIANLVHDIKQQDCHLTTGNLCTKYVLEVLTEAGHGDLAFALATQTTYPSWGFMLLNGATTIWERWEQKTGSGMNSHNHPMFGSVGAWLYRRLAGIQVDETGPGFARFLICPSVPPDMKSARASLKTMRGIIECAWEVQGHEFSLKVQIPVGSEAQIRIPKFIPTDMVSIAESSIVLWAKGQEMGTLKDIHNLQQEGHAIAFTVGSGVYHFMVKFEKS
ncbi:MAG: family 78 glycoside hydrolase catalytic domain [Anaerolineae bacterium]|nr:family 78 glycoside hydrolase catalytic domain [Anaerolineae bacterium]